MFRFFCRSPPAPAMPLPSAPPPAKEDDDLPMAVLVSSGADEAIARRRAWIHRLAEHDPVIYGGIHRVPRAKFLEILPLIDALMATDAYRAWCLGEVNMKLLLQQSMAYPDQAVEHKANIDAFGTLVSQMGSSLFYMREYRAVDVLLETNAHYLLKFSVED